MSSKQFAMSYGSLDLNLGPKRLMLKSVHFWLVDETIVTFARNIEHNYIVYIHQNLEKCFGTTK